MANSSPSTFWTQADALLRKNLTYQKRNMKTNIRLVLIPAVLISMLALGQMWLKETVNEDPTAKCGCICANNTSGNQCPKLCGVKYSEPGQALYCEIPKPPEWPPLLQLDDGPAADLYKMLFTAQNRSFAYSVSGNMFPNAFTTSPSDSMKDSLDSLDTLATYVLGTSAERAGEFGGYNFLEPGLLTGSVIDLQTQCRNDSSGSFRISGIPEPIDLEATCSEAILLWRNSSSEINNELFKFTSSSKKENELFKPGITDSIVSAFDFLNSNVNRFNVTIWYDKGEKGLGSADSLIRIPRYVNLISNAYLQFLRGPGTKMLFEFVKEMPKHETSSKDQANEVVAVIEGLLYTWVILLLFPLIVTTLVYEKQQKLRIIMKMHGLGDGPYWTISYAYFLAISMIYMLYFVIYGSIFGLKFFTLNDYSIQFVFYFVYINLQISLGFLMASLFSNVKTAAVNAYIGLFGTGLVAWGFFQRLIIDTSFPREWIIFMELYPGFALYRGLYEFTEYSRGGSRAGTVGMQWKDVSDKANGMKEVLIIMVAEWIVFLFVAYYLDQVLSSGSGKSPLFFLKRFQKKPLSSSRKPTIQRKLSKVLDEMEKPDVIQEREKVGQLLQQPTNNHPIVCDDLKKIYPGTDGNQDKFAVRGLFLAVPRGECFGMLGPNGAGKSSFISMMIGLTKPSSGSAFVDGLDINTDMDGIYTCIGVCPQHDLLWECLTGREHLLFYGRLKNLQGSVLTQAVEESLKSLNLFHGGVADKQCGKYSGGMKRRLSVAISLIGDPKVVYMDEPSTGLDPASRNCLWNVIKLAKRDRAIILTTHSMEEAEFLCDRLGIFVDGSLQCVGNPKELKGRYGGNYILTMTTSSDHEEDVENMVQQLTPNANRVYHLSGTQKFELPKDEVKIADVFRAVDAAKRNFTVSAWGLADTTLEDVFIKVASGAQIFQT